MTAVVASQLLGLPCKAVAVVAEVGANTPFQSPGAPGGTSALEPPAPRHLCTMAPALMGQGNVKALPCAARQMELIENYKGLEEITELL